MLSIGRTWNISRNVPVFSVLLSENSSHQLLEFSSTGILIKGIEVCIHTLYIYIYII